MKPLSIALCIFFWAVLIFDITLIFTGADYYYRYFTKGLLMPLLFGIIVCEVEHTNKWWSIRVICMALLFSLIGDLVLVGDSITKLNFAIGLGFFWVAQICYILFFYRKRPFRKKNALFLFIAALCILAYIIVMSILMWARRHDQARTLRSAELVRSEGPDRRARQQPLGGWHSRQPCGQVRHDATDHNHDRHNDAADHHDRSPHDDDHRSPGHDRDHHATNDPGAGRHHGQEAGMHQDRQAPGEGERQVRHPDRLHQVPLTTGAGSAPASVSGPCPACGGGAPHPRSRRQHRA